MKKLLCMLLAAALMLCALPTGAVAADTGDSAPFSDIKPGDYFYTPALWAVERGITSGTSPTTFSPGQNCTRGQAITFLWNAAGRPEPKSEECPFSDVPRDAYYRKAVTWAAEQWGALVLFSGGSFAPEQTVTRAEVMTVLWLWAGRPVVNYAMSFTDVSEGDWYAEAVRWAASEKITGGVSATAFGPAEPCNRGQVMTFLYNYLGK